MKNLTFTIETENECNRVITSLEQLEIPYSIRKLGDASFPSLGQVNPYAEVIVDEAHKNIVLTIMQEKPEVLIEEEQILSSPKKKYNIFQILLIIYSIIASILLIKYWHISKNNSYDKNFSYHWNYNNTVLSAVSKSTGNVANQFFDLNYDYNYEEIRNYSKNGDEVTYSFDLNEDGFYEVYRSYNSKDQLIAQGFDKDFDNMYDRQLIILENKDTLVLVDKNSNGFMELAK